MNKVSTSANRSLDLIVKINNEIIAGQEAVRLFRSSEMVDITNLINGSWREYYPTKKSWSLICDALIIKNENCFNELEQAFTNHALIDIQLINGDKQYIGKALITNFPITSGYDDCLTYNITFQGTGSLDYVL